MISEADIEHKFGFHKATVDGENPTLPRHRDVRRLFKDLLRELERIVPDGRAKSVMITELETASMWANKAVAELAPTLLED